MKAKRGRRKKPSTGTDEQPSIGNARDTTSTGMLDSLVNRNGTDANASVQIPCSISDAAFDQVSIAADAPETGLCLTPANATTSLDILSEGLIDTLVDKLVKRLVGCSDQNSQQYTPQRSDVGNMDHGRLQQTELRKSHQLVQYNKQELDKATMVIKEVMQMEAAGPFNVPVDPNSLRTPDYMDFTETPMDFNIIYNNLHKKIKYMTAEDVLKDVELIWSNCQQYNKETDPIMLLMKQVRKRFLKRWAASGLQSDQQRGTLTVPASTTKSSRLVYQGSLCPSVAFQQPQGPMDISELHSAQYQLSLLKGTQAYQNNSCEDVAQQDINVDHAGSGMRPAENARAYQQQQDMHLSGCVGNSHRSASGTLQPQWGFNDQAAYSLLKDKQILSTEPLADVDSDESGSDASILNDHIGQRKENMVGVHHLNTRMFPMNYSLPSGSYPNVKEFQPFPSDSSSDDSSSDLPNKKRSRGPTELRSLWRRREGKRISVDTNDNGEPVGPMAGKLSTFLGTIARNGNLLPLTYATWRKVPIEKKEVMWQIVQSKFDVDQVLKPWVLKNLGSKFRDWKSRLKSKHYYTHLTDEERLADRDKRVLPDQWEFLISFWSSEANQKVSEKNRANVSNQIARHTSGRKSYATLREEERAKRNGEEPTKAELFILTRTRKDGQPVDEVSSKAISQLRQLMTEQPEILQSDGNVEDIIYQSLGRKKPSQARKSRRSEDFKMASVVKRLAEEEVSQMREKMELMERKYEHMESLMTKMLCTIEKSSATGQVSSIPAAVVDSVASGLPLREAPAPSTEQTRISEQPKAMHTEQVSPGSV